MKKNKVTVDHGRGDAAREGQGLASRPTRAPEELTAKNIILATGARARELPGLEADGERSGPTSTRWCRRGCRRSCW
jgi:dihydrolipoamide dehydrogenase